MVRASFALLLRCCYCLFMVRVYLWLWSLYDCLFLVVVSLWLSSLVCYGLVRVIVYLGLWSI